MTYYTCPKDGPFEAEAHTKVSQSAHDVPTVDAQGQHPNMADQVNAQGAALTRDQWELLQVTANPSWTPTYTRVTLDDPVEHQVAVCPVCGTPVKVG